jgi:hypothetical protein
MSLQENVLIHKVINTLQANEQKSAIEWINKITDYLQDNDNGKVLPGWDWEHTQVLVGYHLAKETISVIIDDFGNISGIFMWYRCDEDDGWEFIKNWEPDKPDGNAIFLAFILADNTEAFKKLICDIIAKEPDVLTHKLTTLRERKGGVRKVKYDLRVFNKILKL